MSETPYEKDNPLVDSVPEDFCIEQVDSIPEPPPEVSARLSDPDHSETGETLRPRLRRMARTRRLRAGSGSSSPSSRGWGSPGKAYEKNMIKISGRGITLYVHHEMAYIFTVLLADIDNHLRTRGSSLARRVDDWAYALRKIAGSNTWSNHCWGLAVDFNAENNPMGSRLITEFDPAFIRNLLKTKYRSLFRWGGDYSKRKDAMHFEWMGTIPEARALTDRLRVEVTTPTKHPHTTPIVKAGSDGEYVRDLQGHINFFYRHADNWTPLTVDGDAGESTRDSIARVQRTLGIPVTGVCNARTWETLHQSTKGYRLTEAGKGF